MTWLLAAAGASRVVGEVLSWLVRVLTALSVADWMLVGLAVLLVLWGWVRAAAFARLGTIEIKDVGADGSSLTPVGTKAQLEKGLGERGLLPPSGVPSGSPTKADISNAVASAPVPQAAWIAALIKLVPVPPTSTSFQLSASVVTDDDNKQQRVGLIYRLVCKGPSPNVTLGQALEATWSSTIDTAVKDIYRQIAKDAPAIYPRWAQWASSKALTRFGDGLDAEDEISASEMGGGSVQLKRLNAALACFRAASELDPDNMLARLRAANCLERSAGELDGAAGVTKHVEALEAYISVRLRQPGIFEAGYRASVILSSFARELGKADKSVQDRLWDIVKRLDDADRKIQAAPPTQARSELRQEPQGTPASNTDRDQTQERKRDLGPELERVARREARRARRRLAPWSTIVSERRFRHRFEPSGQERRRLRKALRISQACLGVRKADGGTSWDRLSGLAQVFGSFGLRPYAAGWQADYNAACFYALLLAHWEDRAGKTWIEWLAFRHLRHAVDQSGHELPCRYVRDQDPDLKALRDNTPAFKRILGALCPNELIVHISRPAGVAAHNWTLRASGDAIAPPRPSCYKPSPPLDPPVSEVLFRVRILDENKRVHLALHIGEENAEPREWVIKPVPKTTEVWLYLGHGTVTKDEEPSGWPELPLAARIA